VQARLGALSDFAAELEENAARYRQVAEELDAEERAEHAEGADRAERT